MNGKLTFKDGTTFSGESFGSPTSTAGEAVFATGMVGYPESFTDPSFAGQILILTYPLIGNYGVPDKKFWESDRLQISGLIVSTYNDTPSHFQSTMTLSQWLKKENIPALEIKDTRLLAQKLRDNGAMLSKITFDKDIPFHDPNTDNLVAMVSSKKVVEQGSGKKTVLLIDCGTKKNIERCLLKRGVTVITIPWNFDPFDSKIDLRGRFDAIVVSNGPGDPKMADKTITTMKKALENKIPLLGICLGNQLLALAGGGNTSKLKFGHRSQNQPCIMVGSPRCYITTQNHGFVVSTLPDKFKPWFINANDNTNEGMIHESLPIMSVQFHPESYPGPMDTEWVFDYFLEKANI